MRPGQHQQNRRGRGRNNGNGNNNGGNNAVRKGQNPLSRSFESNGPDVKVRGTPAHIAEKYLTLARDAQSSGDRVLAENYLQHAEHYSRIIMAYREQFQTPGEVQNQPPRRMSGTDGFDIPGEMGEGEDGEGQDDFGVGPQPGPAMQQPSSGHDMGGGSPPPQQQRQPYRQDGQPPRYERNGNQDRGGHNGDNQPRGDRPFRRDGQQQNNRFRDRNDRNNRPYNNNGQQGQGDRQFEPRFDRGERTENRQDNRQDAGQDRGPRPDRPVRIDRQDPMDRGERNDRGERAPQPAFVAPTPHFEAAPVETAPAMETGLPAFVAAPPAVAIPTVAATPRRRQPAADTAASDTPDFLRRPVRRTRAAAPAPDLPTVDVPPAGDDPSSSS